MNTLFFRDLKTKKESTESISDALTHLCSLEARLNLDEFNGWSVLAVILSNELFLRFKEEKRIEERLERSLDLLKRIERRYPSHIFNGYQLTFRYSAPECLRQSTLIHCCDAYLSKGEDLFKEKSVLVKKLKAEKTLKFLSIDDGKGMSRGGFLAAVKLLQNQKLNSEDILANPLGYK
jgi:hypothetical protein